MEFYDETEITVDDRKWVAGPVNFMKIKTFSIISAQEEVAMKELPTNKLISSTIGKNIPINMGIKLLPSSAKFQTLS